jgi:acetylornithine/N-succinyldiaminopimelate aminotransferase
MKTSSQDIIQLTEQYVMNTYARLPVALVKGKGAYVWDAEDKQYIDFFSGLAVTNLGHQHPRVNYALARQIQKLIHVSNLFHIEPQARLAELLVDRSFADKIFFCNSGAEANEGAVKLARLYSQKNFGPDRYEVITMAGSFHGRTLGMISASGQDKLKKGFDPLLEGFVTAPFGDLETLREIVSEKTCAIMVEPIQGEGGVRVASVDYFKGLKDLCQEKKLLLIFDEVQTGIGRTGKLFAYEHYGIVPDIMTLAKGLASGVPIGALCARDYVAETFQPGHHAATFGGNALSTSAGVATLETIEEEQLLENCTQLSQYFIEQLELLKAQFPCIQEIRGVGFMLALELDQPAKPFLDKCLDKGLIINVVQENILRILPPLTVKKKHIDEAVAILTQTLEELA